MTVNEMTTQAPPHRRFLDLMEKMKPRIAAVLPRHLTPERFVKIMLTAAMKTPKIYECTPESVMQSVMTAASLGLDCGGVLGSAYLIPFAKSYKDGDRWAKRMECQLVVGYQGMIDLARRTGHIESIHAVPVWKSDVFKIRFGLAQDIEHEPDPEVVESEENLRGVYAFARLKGGGIAGPVWMNKASIDAVRDQTMKKNRQTEKTGPWFDHYVSMALKTGVRRLFKWLPKSVELVESLDKAESEGGEVAASVLDDIIDSSATAIPVEPDEHPQGGGAQATQPAPANEIVARLRAAQNNKAVGGPVVAPAEPAVKPGGTSVTHGDRPAANTSAAQQSEPRPADSSDSPEDDDALYEAIYEDRNNPPKAGARKRRATTGPEQSGEDFMRSMGG